MRRPNMLIALLVGSLAGSCYSEVGYQPDLVYTGVITASGDPVFYADGYYWLNYNDFWYRSSYSDRGWTYAPYGYYGTIYYGPGGYYHGPRGYNGHVGHGGYDHGHGGYGHPGYHGHSAGGPGGHPSGGPPGGHGGGHPSGAHPSGGHSGGGHH